METLIKYALALITLYILYKCRWDIIGLYIDWIEPRNNDDNPTKWVGVTEDHDYENIKRLIAECETPSMLGVCWRLIEMYQEEYASFTALQKNSRLITLFEEKEAEMKLVATLQNTMSIEKGF